MAFDLKTTLKVLLFASPGPLSIADIQKVFTRYHEREEEIAREAEEEAARLEAAGADPALAEEAARAVAERAAAGDAAGVAGASTAPDATAATGEPPRQLPIPGIRPGRPPSDVPSLVTGSQIRDAMKELEADLRAAGDICCVREGPEGFRLFTQPEHATWVRCLRDEPPPVRLSQSNLETLAVIAYRQPTTRSEIESIRGVSCENSVNKLLDRGLIRIVGRADLPGRPIQYGTTDQFLDFVGVRSTAELPASDVLTRRQIDDWLAAGAKQERLGDREMGLPGIEAELAAASQEILSQEPPAAPPS